MTLGKRKRGQKLLGGMALAILAFAVPQQASAAAVGFVGTGGWGIAGGGAVNDFSCITCTISASGAWNLVLADGLAVSGLFNETFVQVGGATVSAVERVTNVVAINTGLLPVTDNVYFFSDVFSPSLPGTAGVGIVGYYGAAGLLGPTGGVYSASSQAQMNYVSAPFGLAGPPVSWSLTTPSTFATCVPCISPFFFFEAARGVSAGGVVQLVGGINFTLAAGSEIYLPGSLILDDNDPSVYASEVPEPAGFALLGAGCIGLGLLRRRTGRRT